MNIAKLTKTISRVEIKLEMCGKPLYLWVDPGSPNTLVSAKFMTAFGLLPSGTKRYNGKVAGTIFRNKAAIVIPEIILPGCLPLRNIRAITALEGDEWSKIIVLGLNVLNHMTYKISRENSTFEWLESLTSSVNGSDRDKFNHIIWNGKYLLTDDE